MPGHLFIIAGPSGVGKSTLEKRLLAEFDNLAYSVSATTREPRPGEVDGQHYYFMSPEEFKAMEESGELLESAGFFNHNYGTPKGPVIDTLAQGIDLIIDVDPEGVAQLRERTEGGIYITILPPSAAALRERLAGRGTENEDSLSQRLNRAAYELVKLRDLSLAHNPDLLLGYDYLIINDDLETAYQELRSVILATRQGLPGRMGFMTGLLEELK